MRVLKFMLLVLFVFAVSAAEAAERTINVEGIGIGATKPDMAELRVTAVANEKTAAVAMNKVSEKARAILKTLEASGVAAQDIQTGSIMLNPLYPRQKDTTDKAPEVIGYRASIDNRVRVRQLDSLGKVLDGLSKVGTDRLDSIRFFVSDPVVMHTAARKMAVREAMDKAKELAQAAGVELGEIINITDVGQSRPVPQQRMMAFASAEKGVPVMPGLVSVQVRVNMVFAIK